MPPAAAETTAAGGSATDADAPPATTADAGDRLADTLLDGGGDTAVDPAGPGRAARPPAAPPDDAPPPAGRYELRRLLGRGAFGEVWAGVDPRLGRAVAVKVARADRPLSADGRRRFLGEGRQLAKLRHPNLVAVFDAGPDPASLPAGAAPGDLPPPFLVTELVDGRDVKRRSRPTAGRTPRPPPNGSPRPPTGWPPPTPPASCTGT